MLPTYPRFANVVQEALTARVRAIHKGGLLHGVQKIIHHEGTRGRFVDKGDGDEVVVTPVQHSASRSFKNVEVVNSDFGTLLGKFDDLANEMHGTAVRTMLTRMDEAVEKTGNTVDMKGQPLTGEAILQMLEKVSIDFTPAGEPIMPTLIVHPDMVPKLKVLEAEIENDANIQRRRALILAAKKEEWRAREADRRLAG